MEDAVEQRKMLPLIEVMEVVRVISLPPGIPRLSSPKPRLRLGRRHNRLSLLNQSILSSDLWLVLFPHSPLLIPNCSSPKESASIYADYLRFHFPVKGYLFELLRVT